MLRQRLLLQLVLTLEGLSAVTLRHRQRIHPALLRDDVFYDQIKMTNQVDFETRLNRFYLEKLLTEQRLKELDTFSTYLFEKNARQRDKRSYLKLCHFKICNMGRKRTPRSVQALRWI